MRSIKPLNKDDASQITRIYVWGLVVLLVVFVLRLTQLMVFKTANGQDLTTLVHQLYNRDQVVPAKRGTIYDVAGETLATDVKTYSFYAVLTDKYEGMPYVEDKLGTAKALAKHINMSEDDILRLLNQTGVNQTSFGNAGANLSYSVKEAIAQEGLKGIYFNEKISRDYPKGYFSNNIIGLAQDTREDTTVEASGNPLKGVMGIELQYNAQLTGIDGLINYDKDFYGYSVPGTESVIEEVKDGNNIYLTLDSRLNDYLEELMTRVYETYNPKGMTAMVVRPNGDVVSASQRPTFNQKQQLYDENGWVNTIVESAYEPGSTLKVIALAAAINEGKFSPLEMYQSGSIEIEGLKINDWNTEGWGRITYLTGVAQSSNVAFVHIVSELGYDTWKKYLDAFGFGASTHSGFANESVGLNSYHNNQIKVTTSFGQGISATGLQLVQAFTAIANNGQMQKLRFVDRVENAQTKESTYIPTESIGNPIKPETAKWVLTYLEEVIYGEGATGTVYDVEGVRIAAKTGTAQIYSEEKRTYLNDGSYVFSIVAFVPSNKPEYIVYLTIDRPEDKKLTTGSKALSEVFVPFVSFATTYIKQDEESHATPEMKVLPDAVGAEVATAQKVLSDTGFKNVSVLGNGTTVQAQMPTDNLSYTQDTKILLYTGGNVMMPDLTGWAKSDVVKLSSLLGLTLEVEGEGYVHSQSIPSQTLVQQGQTLTVNLSASQSRLLTAQSQTETVSTMTRRTNRSE